MPGYQRRSDLATLIINNHRSRRRMRPDPIGRVSPRNLIFDRGLRSSSGNSSRGQRRGQRVFQRRQHLHSSHPDFAPGTLLMDTNYIHYDDDWSSQPHDHQDNDGSEPGPSNRTIHNDNSSVPYSSNDVDHLNVSSVNDHNNINQNQLVDSSSGGGGGGGRGHDDGQDQNNNNNNQQNNQAAAIRLDPPPRQNFTICDHIQMVGARNFFIPPKIPPSRRCVNRYKKAGFYVCMISTVTCLFLFWNSLVHPFPMVGRQFFVADKFKQMFVTDEDYYPIFAMLVIFHTLVLSAYAVHYTHRPEYDSGFYMYLHSARCLIIFGFAVLIGYTISHYYFYPDPPYVKYLEKIMRSTLTNAQTIKEEQWKTISNDHHYSKLLSNKLPTPSQLKIWEDTQTIFKCCGVNSLEDWFPRGFKNANSLETTRLGFFEKYVPKSCCKKGQSTAERPCDVLRVHKKGCLQSQLELLTHEATWAINPGLLFAVISHLAFYLILGKIYSLTVARSRRGRPFEIATAAAPAAPVPVVANNRNANNAGVLPM